MRAPGRKRVYTIPGHRRRSPFVHRTAPSAHNELQYGGRPVHKVHLQRATKTSLAVSINWALPRSRPAQLLSRRANCRCDPSHPRLSIICMHRYQYRTRQYIERILTHIWRIFDQRLAIGRQFEGIQGRMVGTLITHYRLPTSIDMSAGIHWQEGTHRLSPQFIAEGPSLFLLFEYKT